jgi:hypothetical protein
MKKNRAYINARIRKNIKKTGPLKTLAILSLVGLYWLARRYPFTERRQTRIYPARERRRVNLSIVTPFVFMTTLSGVTAILLSAHLVRLEQPLAAIVIQSLWLIAFSLIFLAENMLRKPKPKPRWHEIE